MCIETSKPINLRNNIITLVNVETSFDVNEKNISLNKKFKLTSLTLRNNELNRLCEFISSNFCMYYKHSALTMINNCWHLQIVCWTLYFELEITNVGRIFKAEIPKACH